MPAATVVGIDHKIGKMMTSQRKNPSEEAVPTRPARRGVQRRDWAVVVAVIVIGLGNGGFSGVDAKSNPAGRS